MKKSFNKVSKNYLVKLMDCIIGKLPASYYKKSKSSSKGYTEPHILNSWLCHFELRFDVIVYRLGAASSIAHARQLINFNKVVIKGKPRCTSSYIVTLHDIIVLPKKEYLINNDYSHIINTQEFYESLLESSQHLDNVIKEEIKLPTVIGENIINLNELALYLKNCNLFIKNIPPYLTFNPITNEAILNSIPTIFNLDIFYLTDNKDNNREKIQQLNNLVRDAYCKLYEFVDKSK